MKFTGKQKDAVGRESFRLAVKAGAGSGKTTVLVERYVRLVTDEGISPQRILAATFTEKAAVEMKERVAEKLIEKGRHRVVSELNSAPICTLHGFCSKLIAPNALELGLDPNYRIMDETEADLLQEESLAEVFSLWYRHKPDDLRRLATLLHWGGDFQVRRGNPPSSRGFARHFLNLVNAVRCAGESDTALFRPIELNTADLEKQCQRLLAELHALSGLTPASAEKCDTAIAGINRYLEVREHKNEQTYRVIRSLMGIRAQGKENLRQAIKKVKEELCPLLLDDLFADFYRQAVEDLNRLYRDFLGTYRKKKAESGALDFLDLEENALRLLDSRPDWTPVEQILIDEAQDLNSVQWKLVLRLSKEIPLFAVGDAQQSIYGFRHAAVELFEQFINIAEEDGENNVISLAENFRSRKPILNAVNRLFGRIWSAGDVSFLKLEGETPYPEGNQDDVELLVAGGSDRPQGKRQEAELLARRIYELVKGVEWRVYEKIGENEKGEIIFQPRPPEWKDVLVLVRSNNSFEPLEEAFNAIGIPFIVQAGRGFWDTLEISDLMALLRCLEDPGDDLSFACLLKSPAVGFDDDDLLELRICPEPDKTGEFQVRPFYEGVRSKADASGEENSLNRRCARFLDLFDRLRLLRERIPLRNLLETWINETGLEQIWARNKKGDLICNNVRKFLRLCDTQTGQPITRLRAMFDRLRSRDLREGVAPAPLTGEGAVQMMTVHAAKGLEAPLVAVFDMNHSSKSSSNTFVFFRRSEAAFVLSNPFQQGDQFETTLYKRIAEKIKETEDAENKRVLYVAMTRAKEKLLLSASCTKAKNGKPRLYGWFKLFVEQMNLDPEKIFHEEDSTYAPVNLLDQEGKETGIVLRRWEPGSGEIPVQSKGEDEVKKTEMLPPGFPRKQAESEVQISVTDWVKGADQVTTTSSEVIASADEEEGGALIGNWVHRVLQFSSLDASDKNLEQSAEEQGRLLLGRQPEVEELEEILGMVDRFRSSSLAAELRRATEVFHEYPLVCQVGKAVVKGKIDLLFRTQNGWHLIDFKSDRWMPVDTEPKSLAYRRQMQVYALMWKMLTGTKPISAELFYLRHGARIAVHLDESELQQLYDIPQNIS